MQHDNKCVCEICNCGQHSCPTNIHPPLDGKSVFQSDYVPHQHQKNPSFKQKESAFMNSYNPEDLKSIYNKDFDKKNVNNPRVKKQYTPATVNLPFESGSEYRNNFVPYQAEHKARPITQQSSIQNVPFTNSSVYNQDFKNFNRERPKKQQYTQNTFQPINRFEGSSTYNNDFHNHPFDKVKQTQFTHRPTQNNTNIPFSSSSVYNQAYQGQQNKDDQKCPVTVLPARPRNCSPGKQHLHYKANKKQWN